jgi:hypothetical protein
MGRITPYVCIYILENNRMFRTTNQTKIGVKIRRIELHNTSTKNNPPLRKKHWGDIYIMPAYSIKNKFWGLFLIGIMYIIEKNKRALVHPSFFFENRLPKISKFNHHVPNQDGNLGGTLHFWSHPSYWVGYAISLFSIAMLNWKVFTTCLLIIIPIESH